jgi:hypothetical protein
MVTSLAPEGYKAPSRARLNFLISLTTNYYTRLVYLYSRSFGSTQRISTLTTTSGVTHILLPSPGDPEHTSSTCVPPTLLATFAAATRRTHRTCLAPGKSAGTDHALPASRSYTRITTSTVLAVNSMLLFVRRTEQIADSAYAR